MGLLNILATLLSLAAFVGWIWLVIVAFKQKPLWGILVLLLSPFTAIFFAIKYWEEAKRPFLIHIGSFVCSFGLMVYLFMYMAAPMMSMAMEASQGGEMDPAKMADSMGVVLNRVEEVGDLDAQEKKDLEQARAILADLEAQGAPAGEPGATGASDAQRSGIQRADARPGISPPNPPAPADGQAPPAAPTLGLSRDGYLTVSTDEADAHVGDTVKVIEVGGNNVTGKLTSTDATRLFLEKAFSAGTITIEVARQDVTSFQVYMR